MSRLANVYGHKPHRLGLAALLLILCGCASAAREGPVADNTAPGVPPSAEGRLDRSPPPGAPRQSTDGSPVRSHSSEAGSPSMATRSAEPLALGKVGPRSGADAAAAAPAARIPAPGLEGALPDLSSAGGYSPRNESAQVPGLPPGYYHGDHGPEPYAPYPLPGHPPAPVQGGEGYARTEDNPFRFVASEPLSTFAIDVDTASYSNVRRFLGQGQLPPADAVRIEEMVNYFDYDYPKPRNDEPFSISVDSMAAPWRPENRLVRIGVQSDAGHDEERPAANLVFLIDVSGSMADPNKLPLVKDSLAMLVEKLGGDDRISIVTYAGNSGLALAPTSGNKQREILDLVMSLEPGGSTHGSAGIEQAYQIARQTFMGGGVNRVILCTDGDFNVGITDQNILTQLIADEAAGGIFLTVLGFGMGNYKDDTLELLADKGNGNYAYIDTDGEAHKVLVEELASTLVTVAKDVKIQVEFNPRFVRAYRLIGYENRMLAAEDFADDTKDAGEVGAGHNVTALYELEPAGVAQDATSDEPLRYQAGTSLGDWLEPSRLDNELLLVKVRYKSPRGDQSRLITKPVGTGVDSEQPGDLRFAAAVAAFGMLLRGSPHAGSASFDMVLDLAEEATSDPYGYRREFVYLVRTAEDTAALGW